MSKTSNAKRRTAIACLTTLSLAALVFAPAAQAASAPTAVTGPNTPSPEGKQRLMGWVGPEESPVSACKFLYGPAEGSYDQEAPCANHPGDEIQALSIGATGGQFKLGFEGQETTDLPFDATAAEVQSALEALPAIGAGAVSVTRPVDTPDFRLYIVTFEGALADTDVAQLQPSSGTAPLSAESGKLYEHAETLNAGGLAEPSEVTAELTGLTPGATYHYRLLAENASGAEESPDAIFRAAAEPPAEQCPNQGSPGVGFLPECRAWEMVSPPDKNGGDISSSERETRAAADGSAVQYASLSPFADASGAGIASAYEAIRTPSGWQTHGILPPQPPTPLNAAAEALDPRYERNFSADLNSGVFFAWRPLDQSDPNVEEVTNLYLREDLRSAGAGHYRLLTACPLCAEKGEKLEGLTGFVAPRYIAASADFRHVVFESKFNLAKPANSAATKLYENEDGTVRLVGILPGGAAASESSAAAHVLNAPHTISADGAKVFWSDGANLYMRFDSGRPDAETVKLNESELSPSQGDGTAHFLDAAPDGAKVFFTDSARLTEDATGGGLYAYDTTKPASDLHNLSFLAPANAALGAGAEGKSAYFLSEEGGLQPGAQKHNFRFGTSLYAWHEGAIRLLGPVPGDLPPRLAPEEFFQEPQVRVTPGGELLFPSGVPALGLTGQYPGFCPATFTKACQQFYTYDPATEALQCVSCAAGRPAEGGGADITGGGGSSQGGLTYHYLNPISADGRHVFFDTAAPLAPGDTNGVTDAYSFDTATSRASLLSSGTDPNPSYFVESTPDGKNAFFTTRQRLSAWDVDRSADLYDARVEGGLPEPPLVSKRCEGEPSCRPAATQPPGPEPTSSESILPEGNPKPPCPPGTRLVRKGTKTRCVKKHHKRRHHHHKRGGRR